MDTGLRRRRILFRRVQAVAAKVEVEVEVEARRQRSFPEDLMVQMVSNVSIRLSMFREIQGLRQVFIAYCNKAIRARSHLSLR